MITENKQHSVPEIRFKGFTNDWEQRELGEVTEVYDGTHQTPDYKHEGIMFLSVENIKTLQSDKYISEEAFENEFKVRPEKGDVLMTRIGDVGTANVITSSEPIAYYVSLALLKKKALNPYFLQASIHSFAVQDEIWKRTLHIAFPKKINKNEIEKVPINFPSEEEQDKIGLFFKELDHLITLHKRKLDGLVTLKDGFLQQMFPAANEVMPRVRFAGFTGNWEERRLEEMLTERNEQFEESEDYPLMSFVGNVGVVPKGEQYDRSFLVKGDGKKYKKTELDDFIYSSNNLETGSIGLNRTGKAVISPVYSIFYSSNDSESLFIGLLSKRKDFINKMIHYRQGVMYGQWRIHERDFLKIIVLTPTISEQNRIIDFFKNVDEQIAAQTAKLEQLRQLKAAYLQRMFI
ncbi:restriction endonuclease subunit S [Paenibacillus sp. NFR01]|uniref:restriction endonuclease subunit S n=1 Tax=Paenibacillus sp. NFR01 TaxID=1566279 RepID=UPI0008BD8CB2|nr:restriction endonuclease subunit S [Paenibacillus sp. NFR01]SEU27508.1 type I restriction enzyme, S subunit [Paenibacillus sp. NFR01]